MARTVNFNLTGRAAATYRRDVMEETLQANRKLIEDRQEKFGNLLSEIKNLDPGGWSKWYDDHLPDFRWWNDSEIKEVFRVLENRIAELNAAMLDDDGELPLALRFIEGEVFEVYPHRETGDIPF